MEAKKVKLVAKKGGNGYVSAYSINISLSEALELGFINEDRSVNEIEKIVKDGTLIIRKAL